MNILGHLDVALRDHAREQEAVRVQVLQRLGVRAVVLSVRIDRGEAHDVDPVVGLLERDQPGHAGAVRLLVAGDRHPGAARLPHRQQVGGGLHGVDRHDPQVRARACRRVASRLARGATGLVRGQPDVRVRGAHLGNPGLVQDRHRDLAGAVVELPDVVDGPRVGRGFARVRGGLARVPTRRVGRVVERGVLDRERAGLAARLRQGEPDPVVHRGRLGRRGSARREARVDVDDLPVGRGQRAGGSVVAGVVAGASARAQRSHREDRKASGERLAESEPQFDFLRIGSERPVVRCAGI